MQRHKYIWLKERVIFTWTNGWDEGEDLSTVSINLLPGTWPIISAGNCKSVIEAKTKSHLLWICCCTISPTTAVIKFPSASAPLQWCSVRQWNSQQRCLPEVLANGRTHTRHDINVTYPLLRLPSPAVECPAVGVALPVYLVTWQSHDRSYVSHSFKWHYT